MTAPKAKTPTVTLIIWPRKMVIHRGKSVVKSLLAEIELAVTVHAHPLSTNASCSDAKTYC